MPDKILALKIHPADAVAVALQPILRGSLIGLQDSQILALEDIPQGHKISLVHIRKGEQVIKYGHSIGSATEDIKAGSWVHTHNLQTNLTGVTEYSYQPVLVRKESIASIPTFLGYRRDDGKVGTRNEIWIINTVGCVNNSAERIAASCRERYRSTSRIEGVYTFQHPYGCSQLRDDLQYTQRVLAGLIRHPNAAGVLVLGLGCENNQLQALLEYTSVKDGKPIKFFNAQDVTDEIEVGIAAVDELAEIVGTFRRVECPASDLVIGVKCGGSDGFSGITANPLVGRITDRITALGGTVILTEVPEMFGAEHILMNRALNEEVFHAIVKMINDFKEYLRRYQQPIDANPSPGNIQGGITTLEEKSLGAIQKGGTAVVTQVLAYGEQATEKGLVLLSAPGNDAVSTTAEVVSGATVLLFTTGRGTPFGAPVSTIKISSNPACGIRAKPKWIDFDAGTLIIEEQRTFEDVADQLFQYILDVASGQARTNNELHGYREIGIFKDGVTL